MNLTELDVAQRIRDGTVPSPVKFSNMWLVKLRITGTGLSYRPKILEHTWRDPNVFLNDEFLARCNGLPVIVDHPENLTLSEEEYKNRVVGSVMLPFIQDDEVWAICRVYMKDILEQIMAGTVSTSPGVSFNSESGSEEVKEGDVSFYIEGKPFLLDHIALVTEERGSLGVWDKNKIPEGVEVTNTGDIDMDEKILQTIIENAMKGVEEKISSVSSRIDSLEQNIQNRADEVAATEQRKADEAAEIQRKADEAQEEENRKADEAEEQRKADEAAEEQRKVDEAAEEKRKADEAEENVRNDSALSEAQSRADSAYSACGKKAPAPFSGERAIDYRKRVLSAMQQHSERFKDANIRAIADAVVLGGMEDIIYADARKAFDAEMTSIKGDLRQRIRNDDAGRRIVEYMGDPNAWLSAFKTPPQFAGNFNTTGSRR